MTRPALALVTEHGEPTITLSEALQRLEGAEELNEGQEATIKIQAAKIGRLERQLREESDPASHPKGKEIQSLVERWKTATGHPRAKLSKDRFDVVKARLKDGYSIEDLELAVDGIAAFPFVVNGMRKREGKPSQRHDSLTLALKGGENTERFANLGHDARKAGWVTWAD